MRHEFVCEICANVVHGNLAFEQHKLQHQKGSIEKLQCEECGTWHKTETTLRLHQRRHADKMAGPYSCDVCQRVYSNRYAMLRHKGFVHSTITKYQCNEWSKSFKRSVSLREHMATHSGAPLYRCLHCPKTFKSNANLHAHRKKSHPTEFEESRKLRLESAYLPGSSPPTITSLCRSSIEPPLDPLSTSSSSTSSTTS